MLNKICVYAICKNEAKEAAEWYENMSEADYVIVVDTGSEDDTVDILRKAGCKVIEHRFEEFRFDEARTFSMELAYKTDANIFLPIDLDERLIPGWADVLRERWDPEIHTRGRFPYYVGSLDTNPGVRNWLHNREWGWLYPVHEVMTRRDGSGIWYTHDHCLDMGELGCWQLHRQDWKKNTRKQYLRLCELRYSENPGDQASFCYLVRENMYANRPEANIALEEEASKIELEGNVGCWIGVFMAWAYEATKQPHKAMAWDYRAYRLDPECRTAPVNLARLLCDEDNPELAYEVLKEAYETAGTWHGNKMFQDAQDVWTWRMDDWMGVVLTRLGRVDEAVRYYETALAEAKQHDEWAVPHVQANLDYVRR